MTRRADDVPVELIREAIEASGLSHNEIARRLGWFGTHPDTGKIRRSLGQCRSGGRRTKQKTVTYERAVQLIDAAGLDPVDYGL